MQRNHHDQQHPTGPHVGCIHQRPQVPHQEQRAQREARGHEDPIEEVDGRPADQRHRDPDEVRVAVQRPALQQIGALAAEPPQDSPQRDGQHERVAVDEPARAAEEREVVREVLHAALGEVLGDGAGDEEDEDDGGGDPEGAVHIRVAIEDVEEVRARIDGHPAAAQDFGGVDVKELCVEGQGPEVAL